MSVGRLRLLAGGLLAVLLYVLLVRPDGSVLSLLAELAEPGASPSASCCPGAAWWWGFCGWKMP